MIGRSSPDTRNGCGAIITIALFCSLSAGYSANAAEINLSDLRGYSIDAEWSDRRVYTKIEVSGQRKRSTLRTRQIEQIYVSKTGRIFHRRTYYDKPNSKPSYQSEKVRSAKSGRFEWTSNATFILRTSPFSNPERTTFIWVRRIKISRSANGFTCTIKVTNALQKGETKYIGVDRRGITRIFHSYKFKERQCEVFKGNVFKGEVGP